MYIVPAIQLEQILLEELNLANKPGLAIAANIPWPNGKPIPNITAAFYLNNTPLAYFSRLSDLNPTTIHQLHKNVWSQSKTPLLFVTLPHEIRVYNGYAIPAETAETLDTPQRLIKTIASLTDHQTARKQIHNELIDQHYERIYLETGAFWNTPEGRKFDPQTRADKQLIASMGQMRNQLRQAGLSNRLAYTLLGRSVFIRYLEDRLVLTPAWTHQITDGQANSYREALAQGHHTTYQLFEQLSQRFNGDLFPVEPEEQGITNAHLNILLNFLNRTDLETGQLSLWPYNFEYIPIELISHIYDTFIENQRESGAYYTPPWLADFVLEETMGHEVIHPGMTVLDPACGSGIFLVGAYRRLVQVWRRLNGEPTAAHLSHLLQHTIFGIDKNEEAVRIAAFSLYLEILNHLTNAQIQDPAFRFPALQTHNLIATDFFAPSVDTYFPPRRFDRIVGNLPWGRGTLTAEMSQWLKTNDYVVGGRQAAPAFMLRIPQFCKETGEIATLAPTKGTILATSQSHQLFRTRFFETFDVRSVVNFSVMRHELFGNVKSPTTAIFYTPNPPDFNQKLVYAVPKPSVLSKHLEAIVLDTTEIKFLDRQQLLDTPELWKIAQWGTPRDAALIQRLKTLPTLREQADRFGWTINEGIQINGGGKNPGPWLAGMSLIPTEQFRPYFINKSTLEKITNTIFHRPRTEFIVKAPIALIRRSLNIASFSYQDVAYLEKITGVVGSVGQEDILKWLVICINSPLSRYYHFTTSSTWAVERDNINQQEYEEMPFWVPDTEDMRLQRVLYHLGQLQLLLDNESIFFDAERVFKQQEHETAIHQLVYELYGVHPVEQQQVEDMLTYGVGFFEWAKQRRRKPEGARPVQRPDVAMLVTYADVFVRTATALLSIKNQTLNATVYQNGAPLTVVTFDWVALEMSQPVRIVTEPEVMRAKLRQLDDLLLEQRTPSLYMRRHVRVYDGGQMSLIKPSEQRFWTQSQARADADAFLAELSSL